jgi:hypothetical protein
MKTRTIRAAQLICALAILPHAHAQNEEDALRIGTLMPGGTGRSAGMANAFGAVGADPASIGINPAGFGLYRTSELSLTPLVEVNDAKATTYGTATGDTQTRFAIGNLALILNTPSNGGDWAQRDLRSGDGPTAEPQPPRPSQWYACAKYLPGKPCHRCGRDRERCGP